MIDREAPEYLTVAQVAEVMQMSRHAVVRLLHAGTLAGRYFGTREGWRIRRVDVDALMSTPTVGLPTVVNGSDVEAGHHE